jgi:hypothetical protein
MAKNVADIFFRWPSGFRLPPPPLRCLTFLANRLGVAGPLKPEQKAIIEEMEREYAKFAGQKNDAKTTTRTVDIQNAL